MFKLMVLACSLVQPNFCVQFEDTRGPYKTIEQCEQRAYEMSQDIYNIQPTMRPISYKCKQLKKGQLT